jgi:hypothetical protein
MAFIAQGIFMHPIMSSIPLNHIIYHDILSKYHDILSKYHDIFIKSH